MSTDKDEVKTAPDRLLAALMGSQPVADGKPAATQEPQEPQGRTVDASTLSPAELRDLWAWGQQLRVRYRCDQTIPECWIVHHAMRAEVLGLRLGWADVAAGTVPLSSWHYTLDLALGRVERRWGGTCASRHHMPDGEPRPEEGWLLGALSTTQEAPATAASHGEQTTGG